jgi:hypothetical protein
VWRPQVHSEHRWLVVVCINPFGADVSAFGFVRDELVELVEMQRMSV